MQTQCMLKVCLSKTGYSITSILLNHFVYIISTVNNFLRVRVRIGGRSCGLHADVTADLAEWRGSIDEQTRCTSTSSQPGRPPAAARQPCVSYTINAFDCHTSNRHSLGGTAISHTEPHVTNTRRCAKTCNSAGVLCNSIHFLFQRANPHTPQKRPTSCHIETVHQSIMWWSCMCDNNVWLWKNPTVVVALQECASGCTARVWRRAVSSRMFWKPLIMVKRVKFKKKNQEKIGWSHRKVDLLGCRGGTTVTPLSEGLASGLALR